MSAMDAVVGARILGEVEEMSLEEVSDDRPQAAKSAIDMGWFNASIEALQRLLQIFKRNSYSFSLILINHSVECFYR